MTEQPIEDTLGDLEATRVAAEDDYLSYVGQLEDRVKQVLDAAAAAEAAARRAESSPLDEATAASIPEPLELARPRRQQADQAPWPASGIGLRGLLNRIARWWLRDYLAVLDARHEALAERSRHLETDLDDTFAALVSRQAELLAGCAQLSETLTDLRNWIRRAWEEQASRGELLRDGLNRVAEAIDLVAGASLRLRRLMNAKDAETVRRVVGGADQKAEVVLDALARRQEALLAELVGRRLELEELVTAARTSD